MPKEQIAEALGALIDSVTESSEVAIIPVIAELQRRICSEKPTILPAALQSLQDKAARLSNQEITQLLQETNIADSMMVQEAMFRLYPQWCEEELI